MSQELAEWAENYFKSRDAIRKEIVSVEKNAEGFTLVFTKKDKKQYISVVADLKHLPAFVAKVGKGPDQYALVTLNTKSNLTHLKKNWDKLAVFPTLNVLFVNPHSSLEHRWMVNPHVHSKITEPKALSKGLDSLFETVDAV